MNTKINYDEIITQAYNLEAEASYMKGIVNDTVKRVKAITSQGALSGNKSLPTIMNQLSAIQTKFERLHSLFVGCADYMRKVVPAVYQSTDAEINTKFKYLTEEVSYAGDFGTEIGLDKSF